MADYGVAALVIAWMYCLSASERLSRQSANIALGVLLGFGLLMKVLFPIYVAGPLLAVIWLRHKKEPALGAARWPLATIAIPAIALAATWYSFHLGSILRYAWQAGYGEI